MSKNMASMVEIARRHCGCVLCVGGYDAGARTIANPSASRPSSCVANTILYVLAQPGNSWSATR